MTQYYIVELQKDQNEEYSHNTYFAYDEDPDTARLKGESKFYSILSQAAVSKYLEHGAILLSSTCDPVLYQCFRHKNTGDANA